MKGALYLGHADYVLSWTPDHDLYLWSGFDGMLLEKFMGHTSELEGALLFNNDSRLLSWSHHEVCTWDVSSGKHLVMFDGFTEPLLLADEIHVLMIECKDIWSSTSYANVFHIRDIVNGELIQPFIGHIRHINGVMFVADETRVLSWADDGMIIVWNIADDSRKDTKPQHCRSVMLQWHGADPVRLVKYQKGGLIECNETESLQCMLGRNKVTLEELVRRQRLDDDGSPESFISQKKQ